MDDLRNLIGEWPDTMQRYAKNGLYRSWASEDPNVIEEKASALSENEKRYMLNEVSQLLVYDMSFAEASDWISKNSGYDVVQPMSYVMICNWTKADPVAAREWINTLPEGDMKDRMLVSHAGTLPPSYREEMNALMESLPDEKREAIQREAAFYRNNINAQSSFHISIGP